MLTKHIRNIILIVVIKCVLGQSDYKSSLSFVIDDTYSMSDDIDEVKRGADAIFDTVVNNHGSQIENFILVTFNDPATNLRTVTTNRDDFKKALSSINVHGGGDCPEYSMSGIELALENSLPNSYLYVFSDASAKDHNRYETVKKIAQKKQSKVVFVLTGICNDENSSDYKVYHKLAKDTLGEVFHLKKDEVGKILEYVKDTIKAPETTLFHGTLTKGNHSIPITFDGKTKDPRVTVTGSHPTVDITAPDGSKPSKSVLVGTDKITIVKPNITVPGIHKIDVGSKSDATLVVTAKSAILFRHGFSTFMPSSIKETSIRPISDIESYLSIKLIEGNISLTTAKIMDMENNTLVTLPLVLSDEKAKFYVTDPVVPPNIMFQIAIIGYDPESKSEITRVSPPVEPSNISAEKLENKVPSVAIDGNSTRIVDFDSPLKLICKVTGFPQPDIVWRNKNNGTTLSGTVSVLDPPYDFINILSIEKVNANATYECKANNPSGSDTKAVTVETELKRHFTILDTPKLIKIQYKKEGKIQCRVDAYPPAEITWLKNRKVLTISDNIEISPDKSVVTIKNMTLSDKGEYICEARNNDTRKIIRKRVQVGGIERPKIDKSMDSTFVKLDSPFTIDCKILQGKPKPSISWSYKPDGVFSEARPLEKWRNQESIVVERAGKTDSGTYLCEVNNEIGRDYHEVELIVTYPPTIAKDVDLIRTIVGKDIFIDCKVDGGPAAEVTWYKDKVTLASNLKFHIFKNHTLRIAVDGLSDSGNYTCQATNMIATAVKSVKVEVSIPASITPPKESDISVIVGNQLLLPCEAKGYPEPEIKWVYRNFQSPDPKVIESNGTTLKVDNIQVDQEGYYTCEATDAGGSSNITYNIYVFAPPVIENIYEDIHLIAVEGDFVLRIPCKVSGNPEPIVTWLKDDLYIAMGTSYYLNRETLIIRNVQKDSEGTYKCLAENPFGTAEKTYKVTVESYPRPGVSTSSIIIEEDKPTLVKCDIPHTRIDQLRWYKHGALIETGELILKKPSVTNSGYYQCRVNNYFGSSTSNVRVTVGHKPRFFMKEEETVELVEGPPIYLSCEAEGIPEPTISWFYYDKKLKATEAFYFLEMGFSDLGRYTCEAKNDFGKVTRSFNVISRDCLVNTNQLSTLQPLIVSPALSWPDADTANGTIVFPRGEHFILYCPSGLKKFSGKYINGFCQGGKTLMLNGNKYDYSDVECKKEVKHTVKRTGEKCLPGNTEKIKIGYNVVAEKTTDVYEVCLDKDKNIPLYSMHVMESSLADVDIETAWSDAEQFHMNFDEAYNCKNQTSLISSWLGKWFHDVDTCCFFKRQLVNPRDVFPGVPQRSTYSYLNVVPQWSTCNADNWDDIERRVRLLVKSSFTEVLVWTGTAQHLSLTTVDRKLITKFLMDLRSNSQPVPLYLWKVVQSPVSKASLAIIQVNVPDLSPADVSKYTLCTDICHLTDWMQSPYWHDVTRGYTYCCSMQDFQRAFGFNGIFNPELSGKLTSGTDLIPRYSLT